MILFKGKIIFQINLQLTLWISFTSNLHTLKIEVSYFY